MAPPAAAAGLGSGDERGQGWEEQRGPRGPAPSPSGAGALQTTDASTSIPRSPVQDSRCRVVVLPEVSVKPRPARGSATFIPAPSQRGHFPRRPVPFTSQQASG